jgi:hypothetical protein
LRSHLNYRDQKNARKKVFFFFINKLKNCLIESQANKFLRSSSSLFLDYFFDGQCRLCQARKEKEKKKNKKNLELGFSRST